MPSFRNPFTRRKATPGAEPDLWVRCPGCSELLFKKSLEKSLRVCAACGHHFRVPARERIVQLVDEGTFVEADASLISLDPIVFTDSKAYPERAAAARGVQVVPGLTFSAGSKPVAADVVARLGANLVVKPNAEGSSVGLALTSTPEALAAKLAAIATGDWLIERRIVGRELSVGVLNGRALGVVEIRPKSGVYDFTSKYTKGLTEYFAPAPLDEAATADDGVDQAGQQGGQAQQQVLEGDVKGHVRTDASGAGGRPGQENGADRGTSPMGWPALRRPSDEAFILGPGRAAAASMATRRVPGWARCTGQRARKGRRPRISAGTQRAPGPSMASGLTGTHSSLSA